MPHIKQTARVVDEDLADDSDDIHSGHTSDSNSDVPREYLIGFSDSIPLPWDKPSDNRATFTNLPLPKKPFPEPSSSGLLLSIDKTTKPVFDSVDCLGVQSCLFLVIWILLFFVADSDLRKLARYLRYNLSDAGRYAKELSKSRRISKSHSRDKRPDACRGSSKSKRVVDEDKTQSSKKNKCTVKYSYSNWPRYFFGDFFNGEFILASDDIPVDLKEAAFIAYWLSKYVFLGPTDECMSQGVFLLACVIAKGKRVPLAPLYLGGLYARLDHFFEQLRIAHGRFPVLAYIDEIFLQLFLFEHFPRFSPSRKLPTILPDKKASFRAWSWGSAYPSRCLEEVIDLEENFSFRPYTSSLHSDASDLHQFYSSDLENDRNEITTGKEGAYDFWLLCTFPTPLPGLIIMDRDYPFGSMICPITYRPDRVSRQLGWDQDPKNVEPSFYLIEDLMKKVLFQSVLPEYDPGLVVPFDIASGVTMEYVEYLECVKKHIRQYEGYFAAEIKSYTPVLVKDPYLMTGNLSPTTVANLEAKCYKSEPSSKRKCDDSAALAEPAKRGKLPSSNAKMVKRSPKKPLKPLVNASPPRVSAGSRVPPSSTSKAKGSYTVACSPMSSQSPVKGTSSLPGKTVKRRSPHLLSKMKTILNTPNNYVSVGDDDSQDEDNGGCSSPSTIGGVFGEGVAQDVFQDNPQVVAECENNVDSGVLYEGNSVGSNIEPIQMVLSSTASHADSRSPFPVSGSSSLTKESPVVTSCDSAHDEFEYFHDDAKALLSRFASSNPSLVLPVDLNPLFKRLGYQAFLNAWEFFTAHTFADLWDIHQDMVEIHLNNLKLFNFSGSLLEKLSSKLKPPSSRVLDFAREEILSKEYDSLSSDVSTFQERIDSLTAELNTKKAKLAGVSLEREQLAKTKEATSSVVTCDDLL
ncbi:hypothetical protein PIB30_095539 [Stylosanthes scabra]|uniref:Aminotransferase-like plant mobile domain-containing protein n=1 Tax=Stylosanthes scabra TaxID=79078 RepID=A0ABU6RWH9_9FABA|nr:hypothetical protein [Stylosanthes scabra]